MDELLFDKKDVFTVLNACDAEEYLNTKGYFAETLSVLNANIKDGITDTLRNIETDNCFSFVTDNDNFPLFLPASKVIKLEKKYRPFKTIEEFKKTLNISDFGEPIEYRDSNGNQYVAVWNGYLEKNNKLEVISLGGWVYTARGLFECCFEFFNEQTEEWQPFGVAE